MSPVPIGGKRCRRWSGLKSDVVFHWIWKKLFCPWKWNVNVNLCNVQQCSKGWIDGYFWRLDKNTKEGRFCGLWNAGCCVTASDVTRSLVTSRLLNDVSYAFFRPPKRPYWSASYKAFSFSCFQFLGRVVQTGSCFSRRVCIFGKIAFMSAGNMVGKCLVPTQFLLCVNISAKNSTLSICTLKK